MSLVATIDAAGIRAPLAKPRIIAHRPGAGFVYTIEGDDTPHRLELANCTLCAAPAAGVVVDKRKAPGA